MTQLKSSHNVHHNLLDKAVTKTCSGPRGGYLDSASCEGQGTTVEEQTRYVISLKLFYWKMQSAIEA